MAETFHRNFFLAGPAGRLEALLWTVPVADPPLVAVVCHPHPLFGGTTHNKVVFQAAKALHLRDIPVLRFNFRGVGQSEGVHDRGIGEQDDVRAALDYLSGEFPRRPILLGGVIAPILWTGLLHSILEALDPVLNQRIDWLWFVISQIGFGVVAGIVVSRQERVRTWQYLPFAVRAGIEAPGAIDEKNGESHPQ